MSFKVIGLLSGLAFLVSCAGSPVDDRRAPSYAPMVGIDNDYEVQCGASLVIIDRYSVGDFYNADGTEKSRGQFCDEYRGNTRIGR